METDREKLKSELVGWLLAHCHRNTFLDWSKTLGELLGPTYVLQEYQHGAD